MTYYPSMINRRTFMCEIIAISNLRCHEIIFVLNAPLGLPAKDIASE